MASDLVVIRRTSTVEEAEVIVAWLDAEGIEATIVDPGNTGVAAFGVTDMEGIAICVADAEAAQRASVLLAEHDKRGGALPAKGGQADPVEVKCSDCGQLNSFPGDTLGTVQQCSQCGAYIDMPEGS